MGTKDIRIDARLNKAVWATGIKNVPHRLRVRLARKRNDDEKATEKLYTVVSHVELSAPLTKSNRAGAFSRLALSCETNPVFSIAGIVTQKVDA